MKCFNSSIYLYSKYWNYVTKLTINIYRLRILTIDHVSSNSRQLGPSSQIIAFCRPNSRIEKIKIMVCKKKYIINLSIDRKKKLNKYMNLSGKMSWLNNSMSLPACVVYMQAWSQCVCMTPMTSSRQDSPPKWISRDVNYLSKILHINVKINIKWLLKLFLHIPRWYMMT